MKYILYLALLAVGVVGLFQPVPAYAGHTEGHPETRCDKDFNFFSVPPWHKYLEKDLNSDGQCDVVVNNINDVWKIALAVLEALGRVAAYVAVGFIIFAGFVYSSSQGNPEKTAKALGTIRLALIGLIVSISASMIVSFIAGRF